MRALAERAGTSISAAHYHFGSKDALLRAVLHRRIEPINARRLERLRQCEASAAPGPASLEDLLDAFIRPSVEAWQAATEGSLRCARHIVAQLHADAHDRMAALRAELFGPTQADFLRALGRALPDRSQAELELGLQLVVGLLVHVVGGHVPVGVAGAEGVEGGEAKMAEGAEQSALDQNALTLRIIDFAAAGLRAKSLTPRDDREVDG